jgi:hypothetical protein
MSFGLRTASVDHLVDLRDVSAGMGTDLQLYAPDQEIEVVVIGVLRDGDHIPSRAGCRPGVRQTRPPVAGTVMLAV